MLLLLAGCDSLRVDALELTPPLLQAPRDEQTAPVGTTVTFRWQPVAGAHRYECEVRHSNDEGTHVMTEFTDQPAAALTFDVPGRYSWRVRARNAEDAAGYWSAIRELSIQGRGDP
jgi:hypothetical protein